VFRGWADTWLAPEFRNWNIVEYLPKVAAPVLAIQGFDDEYGTPAQVETIVEKVSGRAEGKVISTAVTPPMIRPASGSSPKCHGSSPLS